MASLLFSPIPEALVSLGDIIFSPLLSGPLLLAATYSPDTLCDIVQKLGVLCSQGHASSTFNPNRLSTGLSVLFGLSVARLLNKALSSIAANSWRLTASKGWDWPNEVAVVTGGSSGLGKLIVEKLAAIGVRVAVFDVQSMPKSMENNPRIRFYHCDLSSSKSVVAAADAVREELGHPSILINNAGVTLPTPILTQSESDLRRSFDVNTISHWFTTQQFVPHMIEVNKGHIITVASIASFIVLPIAVDYSATKAAAHAFHEGLTCELKHRYKANNVLTTIVHPNFVRTPLVEGFASKLENAGVRMLKPEQVVEPIIAQIKSLRAGQLIIPRSASMMSGIRGWPMWLQEFFRDIFGQSSSTL
ncbi:NAD(P)-binding protein [Xylaria nigripes]|nr:NAD(P)-binding protein [Xylaria nigripes]